MLLELSTVRHDVARLRESLSTVRIVNLVGPAGSGKSSLLAALEPDALIDLTVPRGRTKLRALLTGGPGVIAVDGLDGPADPGRLAALLGDPTPDSVALVVASRVPLAARSGWDRKQPPVVEVTLWRDDEIAALAAHRGLSRTDEQRFVVRLAGGNPLIAAELVAALHRGAQAGAPAADHVADVLIGRLRRECPAATWRTTLRVLASVGFGDVAAIGDDDEFSDAAGLSIVTRSGLGLTVREPFRTVLDLSHRWRQPLEHRSTLIRAGVHRIRMLSESSDPELRMDLALNGLFLADEPYVRAMLFPARPVTPPVEVAAPTDAEHLSGLLRAWARDGDLDTRVVDRLTDGWLRESIGHFHLTRDAEGQPNGLARLVPFAEADKGGVDAVAQQFTEPFATSGDGTFVITGFWPDLASGAALLQRIIRRGVNSGRIVVCTPTPEYQRLASGIGMHHHGPARHTTFGSAHPTEVFSQKTTPDELAAWLSRVLTVTGHQRPPDLLADAIRAALDAIRAGVLPLRSPLLAAPQVGAEIDVREWLVRAVDTLARSDRLADAEAGRTLWHYYFGDPADHAAVAARLRMSPDVYAGHRAYGLAVLTEQFRAQGAELLGHRPPPRTLDDLTADLRALRAAAGSPSFADIANRVAERRAARGLPEAERTPSRITVYDCFRSGRRRLNIELVVDIVRALGGSEQDAARSRHDHAAITTADGRPKVIVG